jgi:hypothetical protein
MGIRFQSKIDLHGIDDRRLFHSHVSHSVFIFVVDFSPQSHAIKQVKIQTGAK